MHNRTLFLTDFNPGSKVEKNVFHVYDIFCYEDLKDVTFEQTKKKLGCPELPLKRYNFFNGVKISELMRSLIISASK